MDDNLGSNLASSLTDYMILGKSMDSAKHGGRSRRMETQRGGSKNL